MRLRAHKRIVIAVSLIEGCEDNSLRTLTMFALPSSHAKYAGDVNGPCDMLGWTCEFDSCGLHSAKWTGI